MAKTTTKGKITLRDGSPAKNYKVIVYDWDLGKDDILGTVYTNDNGEYSVTHDVKQDPGNVRKGRLADVYIEVLTSDGEQRVHRSAINWNFEGTTLSINAVVDAFTTRTHGIITFEDGSPAKGFKVFVWDKDPGYDDLLGQSVSNSQGYYSVEHRTKQDWGESRKGRLGDIYIQVICKFDGFTPAKTSSPVFVDYSYPQLTINEEINEILSTCGVNTIYGKIVFEKSNGTIYDFQGLTVKAYDNDLIKDDFLGETTTDTEGEFVITGFTEEQYGKYGEKKPDIYLKIAQNDQIIWYTETKWRTTLPYNIGTIKIPEINIIGYVKSYKNKGVEKDVSKLIVKIYDKDSLFTELFDDEIAVLPMQYNTKAGLHYFHTTIYGSYDRYTGSDIYVKFFDPDEEEVVKKTDWEGGIDKPQTVTIASLNDPLDIDYKPPTEMVDPPECIGDGGTIWIAANYRSYPVYIYKNNIFQFELASNPGDNSEAPKGIIEKIEADQLYSLVAYNQKWANDITNTSVDYDSIVSVREGRGDCSDTPIIRNWDI